MSLRKHDEDGGGGGFVVAVGADGVRDGDLALTLVLVVVVLHELLLPCRRSSNITTVFLTSHMVLYHIISLFTKHCSYTTTYLFVCLPLLYTILNANSSSKHPTSAAQVVQPYQLHVTNTKRIFIGPTEII